MMRCSISGCKLFVAESGMTALVSKARAAVSLGSSKTPAFGFSLLARTDMVRRDNAER